jgi:outer membrane murein-binding lipoprotein Lpp
MYMHTEIKMDDFGDHPEWAKISDLKAGDIVDLHGFDCASGPVTLEYDEYHGELYFPCSKGKHFIAGQLDADGNLVGITIRPATTIIPTTTQETIPTTTQESPSMSFNADDATSVSKFFQGLADSVIQASTLAKEVEELRTVVEQLKHDVEVYRETTARLDEEVQRLRTERQALQDENAQLRADLDKERSDHATTANLHSIAVGTSDNWHNQFIATAQTLDTTKRERDDAQLKIMELEDALRNMSEARDHWFNTANDVQSKLNSVKVAIAA